MTALLVLVGLLAIAFAARPGGVGDTVRHVGLANTRSVSTPGAPEIEAAPVYILVRRTFLGGGEVRYSYNVVNGSAIPITAISIGYALGAGNQLAILPSGATTDSVPPGSYTSPSGWAFMVVGTEDESKIYIEWERTDPAYEIFGGNSLGGFSVNVPQADSLYERGWWTSWMNDASTFEGLLQDSSVVSVPPSSMEAHEGVIVSPNPGRATGIRFYVPSAVRGTVDVFDAQGRMVRRIFEGDVKAGWNSVDWKGDDGRGGMVSSGTYFVKIEAGTRLRFARFVLVR
jgi:hypothetical protein